MRPIERIERSVVFQNQVTQESRIVKVVLEIQEGNVSIMPVLQAIGNFHEMQLKIYSFSSNKYVMLEEITLNNHDIEPIILAPYSFFASDIVLLKYSFVSRKQDSQSVHKSETSSMKKERSKERTIAEVIDIVKEWRQLHLKPKNKKRLNLQEAAQMIGISKKSLDDYYYQLRLGQKYDFDFRGHLLDRIGILRTFIKEKKNQYRQTGKKNQKINKHPKQLKIIEELNDIDLMPYRRSQNSSEGMDIEEAYKSFSNQEDQYGFIQEDKKSVKSIEDQFYNDFEFLLENPADPFLNLDGDFKRKNFEDSNQNFFF